MSYQQLKQDQLQARKDKSSSAKLLTTLLGEVQKVGKDDGNREPTDAECIKVVEKFLKNNLDTIQHISQHDPRYSELSDENQILQSYLPKQLTPAECGEIIDDLIKAGTTNIGQIMAHFKQNYSGQYNGKELSQLVKNML